MGQDLGFGHIESGSSSVTQNAGQQQVCREVEVIYPAYLNYLSPMVEFVLG